MSSPGRFGSRAGALVMFLLLAGCGAAGARSVEGREDLNIVVVSHGQSSDPFWSVVANGIQDAAADLGVRVGYQAPTSFDIVRMNQLIDAALASRPSGLIVSIPDPDGLAGSIRRVVAAGIPVLSINSGPEDFASLGLLGHIGQTEYESGFAAGQRLTAAGARKALCVNHEVGNVSLDERCRGLRDGMSQSGGSSVVLGISLANPDDAQQRVASALARDADMDGVLTLGPGGAVPTLAALRATNRLGRIPFGTFDLEPGVLAAIRDGQMLFAIDQQPYLQGYLGVTLMVKHLETGTMAGGGQVIRTGPSFVTRETADAVMDLTARGIR
jgi:simple sugar transport system substrate-binding protein